MTYDEKGNYLFTKYQQAFVLNVLFVLTFIYLDLGVKVSLITAIAFIVLAIIIYFLHKPLGFFTVSIAIGSGIAAVYSYLDMGLTFLEGNKKLAIAPVLLLLLIIELFYAWIKLILLEHSHKKIGIGLALFFASSLSVLSYYLGKEYPSYFSGMFLITILFMLIFFSSILSILYMKENWSAQRIIMVSYVIIFVLIFGIVLTIVLEEDSILEFFIPDELLEVKNRKRR